MGQDVSFLMIRELLKTFIRAVIIRESWSLGLNLVKVVANQRDCMSSDRLPNRKPAVD